MSYTADTFVADEQPTTAKWNELWNNDAAFHDGTGIQAGAILPNHLLAAASTLNSWVWDAWTPSWTALTIGNATQVCEYLKIGKTVLFHMFITLGSTSSVSTAPKFSLPVTARSSVYSLTSQVVGHANFLDNPATVDYLGEVRIEDTSTAQILAANVAGTYLTQTAITSTVPFTWANGYKIAVNGFYEAA